MVATSPNRAVVAGRTTMLTGPGYSALVMALLRGRHVEGGAAVDETVGPELEPDAGNRHHRGFVSVKTTQQPFCDFGRAADLPPLPVFGS
jgi:hypothetical protein